VAAHFVKMKKIDYKPYGIFYPPESGHADFLLSKIDGELVPVEVGMGKKNKKQIKKSMNKYNSPYGIVISDTAQRIKKEEDIIYLPIFIFSLS
jgi:predicted AAA+ superfamily ATPase